jgi:hypothetical protein
VQVYVCMLGYMCNPQCLWGWLWLFPLLFRWVQVYGNVDMYFVVGEVRVVCWASMRCVGRVGAKEVAALKGGAAASGRLGGRGPPVAVPWSAESVQGMCLHGICSMVVHEPGCLVEPWWHVSACQGRLCGEAVRDGACRGLCCREE